MIIEWSLWSATEISTKLPELIGKVETRIDDLAESERERNLSAAQSLRVNPIDPEDISERTRNEEISTIAFALAALGRGAIEKAQAASVLVTDEAIEDLRSAHELLRGGRATLHPTGPMQRALSDALQGIVPKEVQRIENGETDVQIVRDELLNLIKSAWGSVPSAFELRLNEMLLLSIDKVRVRHEEDDLFIERFVRDNVHGILELTVPPRLEPTLDVWEEAGYRWAPAATRNIERKRARSLLDVVPDATRVQLKHAQERGDHGALAQNLTEIEDDLETNLRLRLKANPEYRPPVSEIRFRGGPDKFFVDAYSLLQKKDRRALDKFREIRFRRGTVQSAEWYAYALSKLGDTGDVYDITRLLEEAIADEHFRIEQHWTARWNLACAFVQQPARAGQALDILLPVLNEVRVHPQEVLELCLLWAMDQDRQDILSSLFLRTPHYEAHLLALLYEVRQSDLPQGQRLDDHLRRLNRILREPAYQFPEPDDATIPATELDALTRRFADGSLIVAGMEWFSQRLASQGQYWRHKNWEALGRLQEEAGQIDAAWHSKIRQWECTKGNRRLPAKVRATQFRSILNWGSQNNLRNEALRLLQTDGSASGMEQGSLRLFEERLRPPTAASSLAHLSSAQPEQHEVETPSTAVALPAPIQISPTEAEAIIQRVAGKFFNVRDEAELATLNVEAGELLAATAVKHPEVAAAEMEALRDLLQQIITIHQGISAQRGEELISQIRRDMETLSGVSVPFELQSFAQTCRRLGEKLIRSYTTAPQPNVTPPQHLGCFIAGPSAGERYTTRLALRLTNPAETEEMLDIRVAFSTTVPAIRVLQEAIELGDLAPRSSGIAECPIAVSDPIPEEVDVRAHITYKTGGMQRTLQAAGTVPVRPQPEFIPVTLRYMTDAPVTRDRIDLFHGRDDELTRIAQAFAEDRLQRMYYITGIRRVGKSSLMNNLGRQLSTRHIPVVLNLETILQGESMSPIQLVRRLIAEMVHDVQSVPEAPTITMSLPDAEAFVLDTPWSVFENFYMELQRQSERRIVVCFDEVQVLVERIAAPDDELNAGFLAWLNGKAESRSSVLVVCTGSEPYELTQKRYQHNLWGRMGRFPISFVTKSAMKEIAEAPVQSDGVAWLSEAVDKLWDLTEGHPWITQKLAEKVTEELNGEFRRVVGPGDVERAAELVAEDSRTATHWWNEEQNLVSSVHRQLAFLILQNQPKRRAGLSESELGELCQRTGIRSFGKYLDEMRGVEVLTQVADGDEFRWRIKGGFLERYLQGLLQRSVGEAVAATRSEPTQRPAAVMLDFENVKIGLLKHLEKLPSAQQELLRPRLAGPELATRLLTAASQHGRPFQKWAVADWERIAFVGDQKAFRAAGYRTDIASDDKANASDHVLREQIHSVLREMPEVEVYVIATGDGDFHETIKTLKDKGKTVILWALRDSVGRLYGDFLRGPEQIRIEWLDDLVFGDD